MKDGACFGRDPDIWFPKPDDRAGQAQAQAFCRTCQVRTECLILALRLEGSRAASGRGGIWGGMTEEERARLAKRYGSAALAIALVRESAPIG